MEVLLRQNTGYQWYEKDGISFKGYFQLDGEEYSVIRGVDAINKLVNIDTMNDFVSFLRSIDGSYSIIIRRNSLILAAVDRARSLPLYFSEHYISDSAEEIRKQEGIAKDAVNKDNFIELVAVTYLSGHKTAYSQIEQLDLGEAICIEGTRRECVKYFFHLSPVRERSIEEIKRELTEAAYNTFKRIKEVIGNRPVVLSMSGGYDSRFVGCMLKNVGVDDVSCYTYGKADSFEVQQSKKNADALGFRWKCVELTDDWMKQQFDEVGEKFIDSYCGHDYTAYLQNFPAVRKLHEEGWFKPNSVFLTGLCGDMPTGEYVSPEDESRPYDLNSLITACYNSQFNSFIMEKDYEVERKKEIKDFIEKLPINVSDYQTWQSAYDCYYTGTCHAHAYMHMNSTHSFFGYEWLLPYWNKDLLLKWYSIPARYRADQKLYEDWLLNDICKQYGIGQKKTISRYSRKKWKRLLIYNIGGLLNFVLLHLGIPFKRKVDYNNFAPLEVELFKKIKTKNCIYYKKSGFGHMLCHFIMERRYGPKNYKFFYNHSKIKTTY